MADEIDSIREQLARALERLEVLEAELASRDCGDAPPADEPVAAHLSRRRALRTLGASALGAAAGVTGMVGGAGPADAAPGQALVLGTANDSASAQTSVSSTRAQPAGTFRANNTGSGHGLIGTATQSPSAGVYGRNHGNVGVQGVGFTGVDGIGSTTGFGVRGEGRVGVEATGTEYGVSAAGAIGVFGSGETGVTGFGTDGDGAGVYGAGPTGVRGLSTTGVGVEAEGPIALYVRGRVLFSTTGIATIPEGANEVFVDTGTTMTPTSKVLVTPMSSGPAVKFAQPVQGTELFQLRLASAARSEMALAWFLLG